MSLVLTVESSRGNKRHLVTLARTEELVRRSIRQAWFELGKNLKAEANQEILRKPKSGRVYVIRGPAGRLRRHRASAPGETHANLSGRLRKSISWKVFGEDSMVFGYGVSTTVKNKSPRYDKFVEFGTRNMDPRPSLENAIDSIASRSLARDFAISMNKEFNA